MAPSRKSGRPVTVAHVVVNLDIGGLERVVLNLIRGCDPERFRSLLICLRDGGALTDELPEGTPVYALNKKERRDYRLIFQLARILVRENVDIVHCHNFGPLVYGSLAGRATRARVLYTAHGKYSARRLGRRGALRLGSIHRIVAVSEDARRVAIEEAGRDAETIATIINGIDVSAFEPSGARESTRAELGIAPGSPVFGIVARLTPVKDHETLFRAFAAVRKQFPGAVLLVVGDGELETTLSEQVNAMNMEEAIRMLGARRDIPRLLEAMDAFVLSSYSEGLSITLLEASASGLPIVATDVGGNPEVVSDGETGHIVPTRDENALAEAMSRVAGDLEGAARMGRAGRERVAQLFGVDRMVSQYAGIYEELTRGANARRHEPVS